MRIRTLPLLAALLTVASPACAPRGEEPTSVVSRARPSSEHEPAHFDLGDAGVRVMADGSLAGAGGGGAVRLPVQQGSSVEAVWHGRAPGGMLLVYGVTDQESGSAMVAMLDSAATRVLWSVPFPAFNVAAPVVAGTTAYVSGIGFVGAVDLGAGRFLWRHGDLYREGHFNAFEPARVEGDVVVFRETGRNAGDGETWSVRVQRETGALVSSGPQPRHE